MKKVLILSALVVLGGLAFAQKPVQKKVTNVANPNATQTVTGVNDNSGIRTATSNAKAYNYTVQAMSVANVTVMDANITVTPQNAQNKLKVTQAAGISYVLYDANNQAIAKDYIKAASAQIDMNSYQPGEYRLQFVDDKGAEKNFKVFKKEK